jgi:hypothetical protein
LLPQPAPLLQVRKGDNRLTGYLLKQMVEAASIVSSAMRSKLSVEVLFMVLVPYV